MFKEDEEPVRQDDALDHEANAPDYVALKDDEFQAADGESADELADDELAAG